MGEPEPLITDKEVASMLGITLPALWGMCRRRYLPGIKIGRCWRFRRKTIETWIADQEARTNKGVAPVATVSEPPTSLPPTRHRPLRRTRK